MGQGWLVGRGNWISPHPQTTDQSAAHRRFKLLPPASVGSCSIVTYQAPFLPGWTWGSFPGQWGAREGGNQAEWCSPCHDLERHKGEGVRPGGERPALPHAGAGTLCTGGSWSRRGSVQVCRGAGAQPGVPVLAGELTTPTSVSRMGCVYGSTSVLCSDLHL